MTNRSSKQFCLDTAKALNISVAHHNPGEGAKVRVFEEPGKDYFDSHPIFQTDHRSGWFKASLFLEGYVAGRSFNK